MRLLLLVPALLVLGCAKSRPGIPPRHLLLVTCEALRADRTSLYLSMRPTTWLEATEAERREGRAMGLDQLGASGVVFATCTSPSPRTVPALASLLTGVSPRSARVETNAARLPSGVPTLAELFVDSGARAAAFATRSPEGDLAASLARGFDSFGVYPDDAETLAAAAQWLKHDAGDGSRRFTWIHLSGNALPFDRGARTPGVSDQLAAREFGEAATAEEMAALAQKQIAPSKEQLRRFALAYDREVTRTALALSASLQSAFDYTHPDAETSEVWARTVFVFTAPNGILLGEDGDFGRVDRCHEQLTRVPLLVRHPDSLTGERVVSAAVELADLTPTFVEWFDLATPARVEGRSLLALLDSYVERPFARRPTVSRADETAIGVRDERWHLVIENRDGQRRVRLYEPARDPAEREDVAALHPDVVERLTQAGLVSTP